MADRTSTILKALANIGEAQEAELLSYLVEQVILEKSSRIPSFMALYVAERSLAPSVFRTKLGGWPCSEARLRLLPSSLRPVRLTVWEDIREALIKLFLILRVN